MGVEAKCRLGITIRIKEIWKKKMGFGTNCRLGLNKEMQ